LEKALRGESICMFYKKDKPKRIRTRQVAEISNFYSRIDERKFSLGGAGC
jgi:hypothetical protein